MTSFCEKIKHIEWQGHTACCVLKNAVMAHWDYRNRPCCFWTMVGRGSQMSEWVWLNFHPPALEIKKKSNLCQNQIYRLQTWYHRLSVLVDRNNSLMVFVLRNLISRHHKRINLFFAFLFDSSVTIFGFLPYNSNPCPCHMARICHYLLPSSYCLDVRALSLVWPLNLSFLEGLTWTC